MPGFVPRSLSNQHGRIPEIAWAILLLLVGCVLVVLEVFIPSGGIISILAAVSFIASIFIAFQESPTTGPTTGLIFTATTVFAVPTLIALAFKYWPKTPMGKAFLGELPNEEEVLPEDPRRALLGRVGVARSKMLPSGAVEIDGQMIDAVTQGQAIEPGTYVVVCEVRANRVVVRPAGKDQRPSHQNPSDVFRARSKSWASIRWTTRWRESCCQLREPSRQRITTNGWTHLVSVPIPVNSYEFGDSSSACLLTASSLKSSPNRLQVTLSHWTGACDSASDSTTHFATGTHTCSIRPIISTALVLAQGGGLFRGNALWLVLLVVVLIVGAGVLRRSSPATSACGFNR